MNDYTQTQKDILQSMSDAVRLLNTVEAPFVTEELRRAIQAAQDEFRRSNEIAKELQEADSRISDLEKYIF